METGMKITNFLKKYFPWLRYYYHNFLICHHKNVYKRANGNLLPFFERKYKKVFNETPDLSHPKKLTEFIYKKMLADPLPIETVLSDKLLAKEYLISKGFEQYVVKTIKIFDSIESISFDGLPDKFVIKANNDSGSVFIVDKTKGQIIDKNHNKIKFKGMIKRLKQAAKGNYWLLNYEKQYKDIVPKVFAEEYLETSDFDFIVDYKYFCRYGNPLFADVIYSREGGIDHDFYVDVHFNHIFPQESVEKDVIKKVKPKRLSEIILLVSQLSCCLDFVRIDLYYSEKYGIKFGEFTFSPAGGNGKREYPSDQYDIDAGTMIGL